MKEERKGHEKINEEMQQEIELRGLMFER